MKPPVDRGPMPPDPRDLERLGDLLGEDGVGGGHEPEPARQGRTRAARAPRPAGPTSSEDEAGPARLLAAVWEEVVGEEVAANSRPRRLKQGKLTASASSTAWAQTLQFLSETIQARLNERLGGQIVKQVVFHHAGWEEIPRGACRLPSSPADTPGEPGTTPRSHPSSSSGSVHSRAETTLSKEQQEALDNVESMSLEPELKERIARAMRAAFVRDQQDSVR